jgi:AcrR family transcriptional regulator
MSKKGALHLIVAGLVAGKSQAEIAAEAGVSERTVRRRQRDPDVIMAVLEAQVEVQRPQVARLSAMGGTALDCLQTQMDSDDPAVAHRASKTVLERMLVHQSALDQQRLVAMELRSAATS